MKRIHTEEQKEARRIYQREYYAKNKHKLPSDYYSKRYEKRKEQLGEEAFKLENRARMEMYRIKKPNQYRSYQAEYHKDYLKNPANRLIHRVRTKLTALFDYYIQRKIISDQCLQNQKEMLGTTYLEIGEFLTKRGYYKEGKVINHIIPLSYLVKEYKIKNLHVLFDMVNMEVINKTENSKLYNFINDQRQIEVAKILEEKYPECHGLTKNIEALVNGGK